MSMSDKRIIKREKSLLIGYIDDKKVYITDISEKGCQIFIEVYLQKKITQLLHQNEKLVIKVEIPEYDDKEKIIYITIDGEIAWIRNFDDFNLFGIKFDLLDADSLVRIRKIVNYWNFLNSTYGMSE